MNSRKSMLCDHEWVVFSTCLGTHELMLECCKCHAFGTVAEPTGKEWSEAFHAPSKPYRWEDGSRVIIRGQAPRGRHYVGSFDEVSGTFPPARHQQMYMKAMSGEPDPESN